MIERRLIRKIELRSQDYSAFEVSGNLVYLTPEIAEDAVQKFCAGRDALKATGVCRVAGTNDQARYAAREWCGWATVNGVRGAMTAEGFEGRDGPTQSQ